MLDARLPGPLYRCILSISRGSCVCFVHTISQREKGGEGAILGCKCVYHLATVKEGLGAKRKEREGTDDPDCVSQQTET
jgi:hypothetical protein